MNIEAIEKMYDQIIAKDYDRDEFNLLSESRNIVISQIRKNGSMVQVDTVLDLALGTGEILLEIKKIFPNSKFYGIDISQKMMAIAKQKMEINTFHDDAQNIGKYMQPNSINLLIIHYILAYVNPGIIISEAVRLLQPGGLCSIATSTYDSFKTLQKLASKFLSPEALRAQANIPENSDTLKELLKIAGLEIIENIIFKKQLEFSDLNQLYNWGINSSWLTQYFSSFTREQWEMISATPDIFPIKDEFQSTIILAKKI
ncbi:MAG: methyltransferase domain-containing protein [Symploca sp. SIO2D2]|nr:methyltransferase domain-containing protein [Symploca sp. SIO2D2]